MAYPDLQDALAKAYEDSSNRFTPIWVANGEYRPTSSSDQSISFTLTHGVELYGGFSGNERSLRQTLWRPQTGALHSPGCMSAHERQR